MRLQYMYVGPDIENSVLTRSTLLQTGMADLY
jgi:hypothetical protein